MIKTKNLKYNLICFFLALSVCCTLNVSAQNFKSFKDLTFSVLDGESVYLYVDLHLQKVTESRSPFGTNNAAYLVYEAERDFKTNRPWMAIHTLGKVTKAYRHTPSGRMDNNLLQVVSRAFASSGVLYHHLGNFPMALRQSLKGLQLREERFGRRHFTTLNSISNLAALYRDMGKFDESEVLMNELFAGLKAIGRSEGIEQAIAINNRSMLHYSLGRLDEAFRDNTLAQGEALKFLKEKNRDFFPFMINQAILYKEQGELDKAESILVSIKELKERRMGKKKPEYARAINHLASLRMSRGNFTEVEEMLNAAYKIYQKEFGDNHPATAKILANKGLFNALNKNYSMAQTDLIGAIKVQTYILGKYHPDILRSKSYLSSVYELDNKPTDANRIYSEVNDAMMEQIELYLPTMSEHEKSQFWSKSVPLVLNYYGFIEKHGEANNEWLQALLETHWQTKGTLLRSSKQMKRAVLSSKDTSLLASYENWLDRKSDLLKYYSLPKKEVFSLGIKFDQLEKEINEIEKDLVAGTNMQIRPAESVDYSSIQKLLSSDEALLEIIKVQRNFLFDNYSSYLGVLVYPNKSPKLIKLGASNELEGKYLKYYKNTISYKIKDTKSYGVYWSKIAPHLSGVQSLKISSEGVYNQISINTLQDNQGEFVLSKYQIENLSSGKSLLTIPSPKPIQSAFLVGSPSFGEKGTLAPLPGTEKEVRQIDEILKANSVAVELSIGDQASEEKVKAMKNPSLVHVATHGFFETDNVQKTELELGFEGVKREKNPLLKSGLLLTGAEEGLETGKVKDRKENGILTAYEAMDLDLQNTQLVILSACETGLGENVVGEGVYGLQRAFQIAGAASIVTSLWKVNDDATQELMSSFIKFYLASKDKQGAFRRAQIELAKKYEHPYYWGAFVMLN